jgi:hypothetical protein
VPKFALFLSLFLVTFALGAGGVLVNDSRTWLSNWHIPRFGKFTGPSFTMPHNYQAPDWSKYQVQDLSKTWSAQNFTVPKIQISPPRMPQMPPIRMPYVPPPPPMRFGR